MTGLAVTLSLYAAGAFAAGVITPSTSIPVSTGAPSIVQQPEIKRVRATPRGYVIIGTGFGKQPDKVRVYENGAQVPEGALVGVSDKRISVFSIPSGRTGVTVEVAGRRTDASYFTHVEPPANDEVATSVNAVTTFNTDAAAQPRARVQPLPDTRSQATPASARNDDGYLAREVLRLRDRVSSLEAEISMIRQQLGITSR